MVTEPVYINGLSVVAPGLIDRDSVFSILRGDEQWQAEDLPKFIPGILPPNERRRTTPTINLAIQTIQPLFRSEEDLEQIATVFASSDGDLAIDDKICRALAREEKMLSPTLFSNSVHNAPAGYWAIATSLRTSSVSLSAGNETFAAALVDSITQVISERQNVLLVAYDVVAPEPLNTVRRFEYSLGLALRLSLTKESGSSGSIAISLDGEENEVTTCLNKSLEPLRTGNPIGAGLPLMETLVRKPEPLIINIPYIQGKTLQVNYYPA
jgi:hypothetical protein